MKDKVTSVMGFVTAGLIFIWNLPFVLILGIVALFHWLLLDLPKRKKRKQEIVDEVIHWRKHKHKYAYLDYSRNHPFSEWLEEYFIPKYSRKLIAPKYSWGDVLISEQLCNAMYQDSEHGGDDLYTNVAEEDDEIATLFVFNQDGTVTKWTPPMVDESKVNMRKAKALYDKVMQGAITKS